MSTLPLQHARSALTRLPRLAALGTALAMSLWAPVAQAAPPQTGVLCTSDTSPNPTFVLDAKEGYIQLPDGTTMYMWSYAKGGQAFQYPGPVLCVKQGDTVTVVLNNQLSTGDSVSIMFPGQEGVLAGGAPAQPQGSGAALSSLTQAAAQGGSVTYSFVAGEPGTYQYLSGTNPQMQARMGLVGALVVRPTAGANQMYSNANSSFTASEEFMVLLTEIDPYLHWAKEGGMPYSLDSYQARYWLINGRGFPDSISDNLSPFLPDQPYGALARITPFDPALHPFPGAIRYLNFGTEEFPYHPHGNNGLVIGRDGRPLAGPTGQDLSMEKFAVNIGPGQTWDVLFSWHDAEKYDGDQFLANGSPNPNYKPVPVTIPQVNNQEFGIFYSGSPYLGKQGPLPPGASTLNECGAYYVISHNHALFQMSSWGVNATGPITYVRVDPPLPNNCP